MNWMLPIVIGTTAFFYIHSFNKTMIEYKNSEYTMSWNEFINKKVVLLGSPAF